MPYWMMTLTDPIGGSWYRGQISLGAEMVYIQFQEPILTHGVGFAPKIKYTFVALDRIRPYAEFAGGPFWTDLAGKIPEESSQFNFVLMAGFGVSYFLTDQVALNARLSLSTYFQRRHEQSQCRTECESPLRRIFILLLGVRYAALRRHFVWTIIGCCGLIVTLTTGCTRWIETQGHGRQQPRARTSR